MVLDDYDNYAEILAYTLRQWRDRSTSRTSALTLLRNLDLSDEAAEAVIARGVALGLLRDDGSEVRSITDEKE